MPESDTWMSKEIVGADVTSTSITGLKEKIPLQFRVIAENKVGPGEPSEVIGPVIPQSKPGTIINQ